MKERELFEITYLPLHISLLALEDAKLPKYLGSTLRGILGQALYKTNREVYKFLYKNGKQCKDKQDIVKPYIIIPPVVCGTELFVKKGEELNFEILLLGDAIQYASALIAALQKRISIPCTGNVNVLSIEKCGIYTSRKSSEYDRTA